jgi:hypothetical protein
MGIREKFDERIKRKEAEIQELENQIREAKAYLQALQDSLKFLPRDEKTFGSTGSIESILRPNSNIYRTYELLKKTGVALHIDEILKGIGKDTSKKERVSLAGSLGWYVRKKEIFTRPGPNTFGLIGKHEQTEEPPEDFGIDSKSEIDEDVPF